MMDRQAEQDRQAADVGGYRGSWEEVAGVGWQNVTMLSQTGERVR